MTEKQDKLLVALTEEAIEQVGAIRAYRKYQGDNPDYKQRAKIAIGVIGSAVKLRGTIANEQSNALIEIKLLGEHGADSRKRIAG